ncbi:roadblock/LC7 domain-containing protein [Nonomuraea insulae]|uniref:Roadblock/LC7 domain-containing protein n=1 Tax=Nonomuraea insulae TaxID=1616787 RepID=A0ABW1DA61_9ACTN
MNPTHAVSAADRDLGWLLNNLRGNTPGVVHVLVLSRDGLKMCWASGLHADKADQLAAITAGIQSLALAASGEFGDRTGSGQAMVEFGGGLLLMVPAGEGAHLAVVADEDADVGTVAHNMNELVEQIGAFLTAPPRTTDQYDTLP